MILAVRIVSVWLISLATFAAAIGAGGADDIGMVMLIYGVTLSIPALVLFLAAAALERTALRGLAGVACGGATMAVLYLAAPNKDNFAAAAPAFVVLTIGAGLLWSASYYFSRPRSVA